MADFQRLNIIHSKLSTEHYRSVLHSDWSLELHGLHFDWLLSDWLLPDWLPQNMGVVEAFHWLGQLDSLADL